MYLNKELVNWKTDSKKFSISQDRETDGIYKRKDMVNEWCKEVFELVFQNEKRKRKTDTVEKKQC